jgi:hypothetical protein
VVLSTPFEHRAVAPAVLESDLDSGVVAAEG